MIAVDFSIARCSSTAAARRYHIPMPTPQLLSRVLAADESFAAWSARRRREEALIAVMRRLLPRPLAGRVHVADAEGASLALGAEAGAIAAVVRQRSPDLLRALAAS